MESLTEDTRFVIVAGIVFGIVGAMRFFAYSPSTDDDVLRDALEAERQDHHDTQEKLIDVLMAQNQRQEHLLEQALRALEEKQQSPD